MFGTGVRCNVVTLHLQYHILISQLTVRPAMNEVVMSSAGYGQPRNEVRVVLTPITEGRFNISMRCSTPAL